MSKRMIESVLRDGEELYVDWRHFYKNGQVHFLSVCKKYKSDKKRLWL